MGAKIVVSAVSIILVVGVAIGVVVTVHKNGSSSGSDKLSPQMKAISSMCDPTSYKEVCMQTLSSATNNGTTDPKELIKASINLIANNVQSSLNATKSLLASVNDPNIKWSLENCHKLHETASERLQKAIAAVTDSDLTGLGDRAAQVQNWLNPVISNTVTCIDELDDSPAKEQIKSIASNINKITDNALAILGELPKVLAAFDIKLNLTSFQTSRRLLQEDASTEYPSWFPVSDRKLMARGKRGGHPTGPRAVGIAPNAVVAQDGSGQFRTLADALNAYPKGHKGRYVVYVKAGVYQEFYVLTKEKVNVFIYGDGARRTIITGDKSVIKSHLKTSQTPTFAVEANGFIARDIGFTNTAGPDGEQAVALRVNADMCAFFSVRIDGYQDSLYVQSGLQFYRNCVISGTVDFIFGDSSTIIQNSLIIIRKGRKGNQNTVTAPGNEEQHETTALVLHNCRIVPEQLLVPEKFVIKSYLGRPWKKYAKSIIMETEIGDFIQPAGYLSWNGDQTGYFGEYGNRGPGADTSRRVNWRGFKIMGKADAEQYTVQRYLNVKVPWVRFTGIKYIPGLFRP
ncbi:pectinesterase 4-like [Punica granatum]|uniref:Pectinesterase n=2 Tax=Punica granatum TaxID=22663 RepID=A0A2I0HV49_PUNGR|nr:pectinesterase 4-like [Punica granatum]PKI35572.1 hypothetical protein CRG98_044026 [Punica granatum]